MTYPLSDRDLDPLDRSGTGRSLSCSARASQEWNLLIEPPVQVNDPERLVALAAGEAAQHEPKEELDRMVRVKHAIAETVLGSEIQLKQDVVEAFLAVVANPVHLKLVYRVNQSTRILMTS